MNIGQLDRYLTVWHQTVSISNGEPVYGYEEAGNIWARINFTSGVEQIQGDKRTGVSNVDFLVRYGDAKALPISDTCLIQDEDGTYYTVLAQDEDTRYGRHNAVLIKAQVRR